LGEGGQRRGEGRNAGQRGYDSGKFHGGCLSLLIYLDNAMGRHSL
jgi:hypothetical protein